MRVDSPTGDLRRVWPVGEVDSGQHFAGGRVYRNGVLLLWPAALCMGHCPRFTALGWHDPDDPVESLVTGALRGAFESRRKLLLRSPGNLGVIEERCGGGRGGSVECLSKVPDVRSGMLRPGQAGGREEERARASHAPSAPCHPIPARASPAPRAGITRVRRLPLRTLRNTQILRSDAASTHSQLAASSL